MIGNHRDGYLMFVGFALLLLSFTALLGHVLGVPVLHNWGSPTMPFNAITCFFLIGLGFLAMALKK